MQLDHLYKELAIALGQTVTDEGLVMMQLGDTLTPCTVTHEGVTKNLAIPTRDVLRKGDWDHIVAMHPLCESATMKESPVLKKLRLLANLRINAVTSSIMMELMEIAVNTDYHKKLSAAASKYLVHIPEADNKMLTALSKVLQRVSVVGEHRLVNIFLRHGGTWGGRDVFRLASTTFPIMDEELGEGAEIFGIKMRKKDKAGILNLFRFIYPRLDDVGHYSYGSNSMVAPFFHALFKAYGKVITRLNAIIKTHGKYFQDEDGNTVADSLTTNVDWLEQFEDLSVFRDLIPVLNWNDGTYDAGTTPEVAPGALVEPQHQQALTPSHQVQPATATVPPVQPQYQQPTQSVAPKTGAVQWDDIVRQRQQASGQLPQQQPMQWNQPAPPPNSASQNMRGQPMNRGWGQQQWGQQQRWGQPQQPPQQVVWGGQPPQQQGWGQQAPVQGGWTGNNYPSSI